MALLQISEPGQSPNPHQRRIAVGAADGRRGGLVGAADDPLFRRAALHGCRNVRRRRQGLIPYAFRFRP